jgi:hypothetical protein
VTPNGWRHPQNGSLSVLIPLNTQFFAYFLASRRQPWPWLPQSWSTLVCHDGTWTRSNLSAQQKLPIGYTSQLQLPPPNIPQQCQTGDPCLWDQNFGLHQLSFLRRQKGEHRRFPGATGLWEFSLRISECFVTFGGSLGFNDTVVGVLRKAFQDFAICPNFQDLCANFQHIAQQSCYDGMSNWSLGWATCEAISKASRISFRQLIWLLY